MSLGGSLQEAIDKVVKEENNVPPGEEHPVVVYVGGEGVFGVEMREGQTILDLKKKVKQRARIPVSRQVMMFDDQELYDDRVFTADDLGKMMAKSNMVTVLQHLLLDGILMCDQAQIDEGFYVRLFEDAIVVFRSRFDPNSVVQRIRLRPDSTLTQKTSAQGGGFSVTTGKKTLQFASFKVKEEEEWINTIQLAIDQLNAHNDIKG
uniref:Ubiquitin-like domain-containing protein n=1 Tax=Paramoeba aestuarina TaxID=180227 RepID=A0A7S4KKM2_9EUKA|mmetsp:Transcript_20801/g.32468  ORF Transcript_20801/g.32468 Transcript_20801/m.32468 type:complete len:206 (+) Transcript_20801:33-650(+)|eukprot:CAMPEP_0201508304 /NCGR_PEP_ID=MMETSP0161_2-20130828/1719_1 /ASSEMBLY_ACC=CAM_ASM_000251 /TAXON_ID=180227 /ORGANISM="Neoparamoeba aestuarina, Strain SoJaBio B1-5/56/2" /LENGTH=205 /DNA_ID=CAMNT_0047902935 /DNA_START=27 /DNA_END=644 /DNA_ORIENTATION=-